MNAPEDVLAGILAEHEPIALAVAGESDHECRVVKWPLPGGCGCTRPILGCSGCDWRGDAGDERSHRAHVAQVLAEYIEGVLADARKETR